MYEKLVLLDARKEGIDKRAKMGIDIDDCLDEQRRYIVHTDFASQKTERDAICLIGTLTGNYDCVPCEGTPNKEVSFKDEHGLGFMITYSVEETVGNTCILNDMHVYRDSRWDDTSTMTPNELLAKCQWAVLWVSTWNESDWEVDSVFDDKDRAVDKLDDLAQRYPKEYYRLVRIVHEQPSE